MKLGYIAIGCFGTTVHLTDADKHPRGQLLTKLGAKHASRILYDCKDGSIKHTGYVVNREWFSVYEIHEWAN